MERAKDIALIILLGIVICLWLFRGCGKSKPDQYVRPTKIATDTKKGVELKQEAKIKDSIRIHWVNKYRADKTNPLKLPCDTFIKVIIADCDTVIVKDSVEVVSLQKVIKQDSVVIVDYQQQANADSVTITKLERKVRRNRVLAKWAFVTGLGLGGWVGWKLK